MGIFAEITGTEEVFKKLDAMPGEVTDAIKQMYGAAASNTFNGSQADVPVDKGDLRGSGYIDPHDSGDNFYIDVGYGDGQETSQTYTYPPGEATTQYREGDIEARGYAWFQELGFMSRAGNPVPGRAYLGPNFDVNVQMLVDELKSLGFGVEIS